MKYKLNFIMKMLMEILTQENYCFSFILFHWQTCALHVDPFRNFTKSTVEVCDE